MVAIRDIAQATGVSATTVSNVIHSRNKRVSAETIQSINDAIKELVAFLQNWNMNGLFFTGIFKDKFFDSVAG